MKLSMNFLRISSIFLFIILLGVSGCKKSSSSSSSKTYASGTYTGFLGSDSAVVVIDKQSESNIVVHLTTKHGFYGYTSLNYNTTMAGEGSEGGININGASVSGGQPSFIGGTIEGKKLSCYFWTSLFTGYKP
ncbi:MAG: hypothetical protein NT040_02895 [Bacteroidetes bacterium]|nr:hypothetical protein [Bacteroidota bacterium]